ncbi:fimbria/pilus outer membrane usher protein [Bordetella sp. 15P40C-2]|uniref:fimbria/pilus outer membrane usher protein n=1 Tax=Bordetella sp. 15P40C-2 TaxID=2572246 RepID=UPI00132CC051|nr:fimbria/pilus outer membrane usher protein [Bordetella sp. 15P40C-2]MVW72521.1 fimbria/pilus outer membrane usher protein [Bordetella sp. 15P40C-2]
MGHLIDLHPRVRAIKPNVGRCKQGQTWRRARGCTLASLSASLLVLSFTAGLVHATPATVEFDSDALKSRGLSTEVGEYFKHGARFREGVSSVTVFVNDRRIGTVKARFDEHGDVCLDQEFLDRAGLRLRSPSSADKNGTCTEFLNQYPTTIIKPNPGRDEVRLIVPTESIRSEVEPHRSYATGGTAAMLNYDALVTHSQYRGGSQQFRYLQSEVGLNAGDWVLRSRQSYVESSGRTRFDHLYAYGQKTFTDLGQIFQAGQISIANSLFSSDSITGVQFMPEQALQESRRARPSLVNGIANSPARIEVRQNDTLIYSTVVPQGPFSLTDIPVLNRSSDLHVSVIENIGARRTFVVPAAELTSGNLGGVPGYSVALGQYRPYGSGSNTRKPLLATGTGTWSLDNKTDITAGVMAASDYYAAGFAANRSLTPGTNISARQVASYATDKHVGGAQTSVSLSTQITQSISAGLGGTIQTSGYRDLSDVVTDQGPGKWYLSRNRTQFTGSLGWSDETFGSVTGSYSRSTTFDGRQTQFITGSWTKAFKAATVSLNLQHSTGGRFASGNTALLSVSIPFGGRSVRTYVDHTDGRIRTGADVSEQVNDYVGYSLAVERDQSDRSTNVSGNLNLLPRYFQANLGVARNGNTSTMYSGQVRGGVAVHSSGVTLSPYPIYDTFEIAKVGDLSGVKIATSQGPVWTDMKGQAVVPNLAPFQTSRLQVSTTSLPRNVDLNNGFRELEAARGTVQHVDFDVISTRRVLLNTSMSNGGVLAKGTSIVDAKGNFVTAVLNNGKIFLSDANASTALHAELSNAKQCELVFDLGAKPNMDKYFETADAVCRLPAQG